MKKVLVAAAWPYVNGEIHIGHLVGYFIPCDIFARYSRMRGYDTLLVSGADCHGTPITVEADKRGISSQELVDLYIPKPHELIKLYNISYDIFTSTVTENHKEVTQQIFLKLLENGFIIKEKSQQHYSPTENKFLPDRYVEGECPYCHAKEQRADQCENCGRSLAMGELINPYSKLTKSEVTLKETEHYFIDLEKLQPGIETYVEKHKGLWKDWVWKETMGFLKEGLKQRAITRDLDWGVEIPVDRIPEDMKIENVESKRFYVWFEAVIGYLSATVEYCKANGRDYNDFWKNPDAYHYYFMGQDNLTFHTIFWPGQLIGQEEGYNLPYFPNIVKFLNVNGAKLSKSRGNVINAIQVGSHWDPDLVRFYLLSILPESKEGNWDWTDFKNTINAELVGNIGNFIHRTLSFYQNKLDSNISNTELDPEVAAACTKAFIDVSDNLEKGQFVAALDTIKQFSSFGNKYFNDGEPWKLLKTDQAAGEKVVYNSIQIVYALSQLLSIFLPTSMSKLHGELGLDASVLTPTLGEDKYLFKALDISNLKINGAIQPLFGKVEDAEIEAFVSE